MATEKMGAYKKKGAAESKELSEKGPVDGRDETMNNKGSDTMGPGRGSKKGDQSATKLDYEGPGRSSGYTQNFGPARVNGYSKGAAKVNSIMGRGAAQGFDAEKLKAFALNKGSEVNTDRIEKRNSEMEERSLGQYADSLNLVKADKGNTAEKMYGRGLTYGNVAGGGNDNVSKGLRGGGVSADSMKALQFPTEIKARQKIAGDQMIKDFGLSQD